MSYTILTASSVLVVVLVLLLCREVRLRDWAGARCLSADQPGIYAHSNSSVPKRRRKVTGKPSLN